ncbi:MAG: polysaccharide deacetylase family protein [Planctomycetes bacterium]|nr:polysaccharide deacetylase family protein [Planctomycetota bacterium]
MTGLRERARWIRSQLVQRAQMLRGDLAVLMYHRVCPADDHAFLQRGGVPWISPATFRAQMEFLRAHDFAVLPLDEALAKIARRERLRPRTLAITFDDGYRDNLEHAAPVLRELELPATFFLATALLEKRRLLWEHVVMLAEERLGRAAVRELASRAGLALPPDREVLGTATHAASLATREQLVAALRAALALPADEERELVRALYLDADGVRALAQGALAIGSHGHAHHSYATLTEAEAVADLEQARARLEELRLPSISKIFCSAYGGHTPREVPHLVRLGYRGALGVKLGTNGARLDPFDVRRIALGESSWHRLRFLDRAAPWNHRLHAFR